jgi:cell division protease FtsH
MLDEANNTTTFADVAGCDEAKEEVKELVDFLKDPQKFQKLGGRIPRGVLLVGPPGTGKTLLAKAIAGEAKVPFFSISGSDFVEMFVGVGAARVRDMFEQAKKSAPCIIFIDEIDAVGRHRGAGLGGGNDEREQTLNQMLVEMDGFETNLGVIVMAATNRPDILDPALLRPGRFDRQVYVTLPDVRGREQILGVHMRKVPVGQDIRADILARGTPGFSGADLANLVNEAALFAARRNGRVVEMVDFEKAKDKIMMGPERKSMVMPEEERKNTAYHEAGHALVARLMPKTDPVHKVTVIPRGRALGVTMQLPEGDRYSMDKERMLSTISVLFGGRIAEEVFMNQMTTGASNDFERATHIARDMVTRYGMTDELGPMVYAENEGEVFLGRSVTKTTTMSEETMRKVDSVIRRIIDEQYTIARQLIEDNKDKMHAMAQALLEWETIDSDQIDDIMGGKPPRTPKDWTPSASKTSGNPPSGGCRQCAGCGLTASQLFVSGRRGFGPVSFFRTKPAPVQIRTTWHCAQACETPVPLKITAKEPGDEQKLFWHRRHSGHSGPATHHARLHVAPGPCGGACVAPQCAAPHGADWQGHAHLRLHAGVIAGSRFCASAGVDVLLSGPLPTPGVAYLTRALERWILGVSSALRTTPLPTTASSSSRRGAKSCPTSGRPEVEAALELAPKWADSASWARHAAWPTPAGATSSSARAPCRTVCRCVA